MLQVMPQRGEIEIEQNIRERLSSADGESAHHVAQAALKLAALRRVSRADVSQKSSSFDTSGNCRSQ
jgi:hypothetical protein